MNTRGDESRRASPLLLGAAFAAGAAVMVLELVGVRLLAPHFGQSLIVWTNVLGVVLAALAVGQWLGGRWSEGGRGPGPAALLLVAGAGALVLPEIVAGLSGRVLPVDLALVEAHDLVLWGSLLAAVLGLALPVAALGAVTPWLVAAYRGAGAAPGRAAGALLAAGTAGSLLGTFGATHLLVQTVGSSTSVRLAGVVLLLSALLVRGVGRPPRAAWMVVLLPASLALLLPAEERGPAGARRLVAEETSYQFVAVDEEPDGTRLLRINEGLDSFHSVWRPGGPLTGRYFDAFLVPTLLAPGEPGTRRVGIVGLAAGTMARLVNAFVPGACTVGFEIDPAIIALGRAWFDLPSSTEVVVGDGRIALRADGGGFDALLVDAYAQQMYLPFHLCTAEFFGLVRDRLAPGGVAALNLNGLSREDPVVAAVSSTFAAAFEGARLARVPGTRNLLLLGFRDRPLAPEELASRLGRALEGEAELGPTLAWALDPAAFAAVAPASPGSRDWLSDDRAPVEQLAHASWRTEGSAGPAADAPTWSTAARTLDGVRTLLRQGRFAEAEAALDALPDDASSSDLAHAALLAGNLAFERRCFDEAEVLYAEATQRFRTVDAPGPGAVAAEENLERARQELARAARLQARSRTLVVVLAGVALAGVLAVAGLLQSLRAPAAASTARAARGRRERPV